MSKLFTPYNLSGLALKNRVVMAPMTRTRTMNDVPDEVVALYYAQRASAGLLITEGMPVYVRTVGFSLAFSLATAIFGDLTPAISTALVELTGDKSAPGWWLMCAALCGFIATALLFVRLSRGYQPAESQR